MPDYSWPPLNQRKVIGKPISRLDGIEKASGHAKYTSDFRKDNMLHAAVLTSPHAAAKIKSVDIGSAEKMPGVKGIRLTVKPGDEIRWAGWEIAFVAAETEPQARDAARAIKVEYDVLAHVVQENDLAKVGTRAKPAGEGIEGDPVKAFKEADFISEGVYGIPVLAHCCLEPHGNVVEWNGDKVEYNPSTQSLSTIGGDLARQLEIPAANVHTYMQHIGGGFGSKFQPDRWGLESARIAKEAKRPVRVYLERATELVIAGVRPSAFGKIRLAAKKDGTIIGWDSDTWASGGFTGGGSPPIPYVFTRIPNQRKNHTSVALNCAPQRAWRAPNNMQASYLTCSAIEDLAAKMKMDPYDVFMKNFDWTPRAETYKRQLAKAAELSEWKKLWHPRGDGSGTIRRGLGIGVNTWGGAGHQSTARTNIHPDGSVEIEIGSQDLGTGTRTTITQVAAESLGLPMSMVKVKLGDSNFPYSGTSGGSTTIGGVSSSTRKSSLNALDKLFEAVAPSLSAQANELEAVDGTIRVKGNPSKSISWKLGCQKLGVRTISETGTNDPKLAPKEGLNSQGVGGIQIADVAVDMETGIVRMNRIVAVQDCGTIINPKLAESQVNGACIMSICGALMEERVMDRVSGRQLNADMEFYKLAGIKDIGEIVVHMEIDEVNDKRGVIGLGEPPTVGGIAAIGNAVANAIGVRVSDVPVTPERVLAAIMKGRNA